MGATFSRIKNWIAETLTNTDLNAEIDNILNNLGPAGVDDYSTNATQMRLTTDPGEASTESLATSLSGELERLRFVLKEMKGSGVNYWYETSSTSLTDLNAAIGGGFPSNRISSGKASANSSQLISLAPSGSTTSITLDGSVTPFVYYISGTQYSITASVTITGLSAAPASNNGALVGDGQAGSAQYTEFLGEYGTTFMLSGAGSQIGNNAGSYQAFQINNGSQTEFMVAYIQSTAALTKAWRGCFVDSTQTARPRIAFTTADNVTMLKMGWIFATTSNSMAVTYTTPVYAASQPSSPITGDYWFDIANTAWKTYNSTSWVAANATLIGMCAQTSTACVAARTFDKFTSIQDTNTLQLEWLSNSVVQVRDQFGLINVFGNSLSFGLRLPTWDIAANLDAGLTEAASTFYYLYLKENGAPVITTKVPTDFRGSRGGLYHPQEMWRCVGCVYNDASSNFLQDTVYSFRPSLDDTSIRAGHTNGLGNYVLNQTASAGAITFQIRDQIGNYPSDLVPTYLSFRNATASKGYHSGIPLRSMPAVTIPSGATFGHGTAADSYVFIYGVNSSGTISMACSSTPFDDERLNNIFPVSASSHVGQTLWGSATISSVPVKYLGKAYYANGIAGTWVAPAYLSCDNQNRFRNEYQQNAWSNFQITSAVGIYHQFTANSVLLGPGDWEVNGAVQWNGTSNVVGNVMYGIFGANGNNSATVPAAVTSLGGTSLITGYEGSSQRWSTEVSAQKLQYYAGVIPDIRIRISTAQTVYACASSTATGTGVNILGYIYARRIVSPRE